MDDYQALADGLAIHMATLNAEMQAARSAEERAGLPLLTVEAPAPLLARLAALFASDPPLWKDFQTAVGADRSRDALQAGRHFLRQAALAAAAIQNALRAWQEQLAASLDPAARSRAVDGVQALRVARAQLDKAADPRGLTGHINDRAGGPLVCELACLALGQLFAEVPPLWQQFQSAVKAARFTNGGPARDKEALPDPPPRRAPLMPR